ncbi:MAG: outer membrane lipoprotein-sorting protein [Lentisphaerae bacterium]|nr:outer membrane lipoprotein-sorting protein [Lentisphaerota bacterium]
MRPAVLIAAACCAAGLAGGAEPGSAGTPDGPELLRQVVAGLPDTPLRVRGALEVRRRKGLPVRELGFEMQLDWGADPPRARYCILDRFGGVLETMTVRLTDSGASYVHSSGSVPPLAAPIRDTDISWADLTLSFLWWTNAVVTGGDTFRGRDCYVVEARDGAGGGYRRVRLWIDKALRVLLRAEGYGTDGGIRRRLWIRSVKQVDARWMIKDLDVESVPAAHRTRLRVEDVFETANHGETTGGSHADDAGGRGGG